MLKSLWWAPTKWCLIGALKKIKRCLVQGKGCGLCISGKFKKLLGEYQHKLADFIYYKLPQPLDTWRKLKVYIRRSEDVLDVFWTSFVHSIYMPRGQSFITVPILILSQLLASTLATYSHYSKCDCTYRFS